MENEKERLLHLLSTDKISQDDFGILSDALDGKPSRLQIGLLLLVNPFQKIAGIEAGALGLLILGVMSALALKAQVHYPGLFDLQLYGIKETPSVKLTFWILMYQNCVTVSLLSLAYFTFGRLNKIKGLRFQDFLGTILLSRFPYLIATLIFYILFVSMGTSIDIHDIQPVTATVIAGVAIIALVWQTLTYFYALKESSGLLGKKLWTGFIGSVVTVEILSIFLTQIFF